MIHCLQSWYSQSQILYVSVMKIYGLLCNFHVTQNQCQNKIINPNQSWPPCLDRSTLLIIFTINKVKLDTPRIYFRQDQILLIINIRRWLNVMCGAVREQNYQISTRSFLYFIKGFWYLLFDLQNITNRNWE